MLGICIFLLLNTVVIRANIEGFIVGGSFAEIRRNPHSAFLAIDCISSHGDGENNFVCGASILNHLILLTAAHCLHSCVANTRITIRVGNKNKLQGIMRYASGYAIHENYNQYTIVNDIAIVKMARAVPLSAAVSRVAILRHPPYSETARLAGWGMINEKTSQYGTDLKEINQKVYSRVNCITEFGYETLPIGTICASSQRQHEFPSSGDSGGALVVRGYIQIGLVSYKSVVIAPNVVIYTDIGYHYDWITKMARSLYCTNQFI